MFSAIIMTVAVGTRIAILLCTVIPIINSVWTALSLKREVSQNNPCIIPYKTFRTHLPILLIMMVRKWCQWRGGALLRGRYWIVKGNLTFPSSLLRYPDPPAPSPPKLDDLGFAKTDSFLTRIFPWAVGALKGCICICQL